MGSIRKRTNRFEQDLQEAVKKQFWRNFAPRTAVRGPRWQCLGTPQKTIGVTEGRLERPGYMRLAEVLSIYPVSRAAWYEGVRRGIYPAPVRLGERSVGYRVSEINALIADPPSYQAEKKAD